MMMRQAGTRAAKLEASTRLMIKWLFYNSIMSFGKERIRPWQDPPFKRNELCYSSTVGD